MTANPFRLAPLVVAGIIAGLAHVTLGVAMYLAGVYFAPWSMWPFLAMTATCIAVGNWWYGKRVLAGRTTYPKALLGGVVISVMIGLVYITYNFISISFIYSHFLEDWVQAMYATDSVGLDAAAAAALLDRLHAEISLPRIMVNNLRMMSVTGSVLSLLISVAFIGRWRRAPKGIPEHV